MSNKNFGKKLAIGFLVLFLIEGIAFIVIWRMLSDPSSHLAKDFASWTEHSSQSSNDDATTDFPTEERARQALSRSNRILALLPDDKESLGIRARAYNRLGENDLALLDYKKLNTIEPGKPFWLGLMAGTYYNLNRKQEAADCYAQAYQAESKLSKDAPEMKYIRWHPVLEQIVCYIDLDKRDKALALLGQLPLADKRLDAQSLIPVYLRLGKFDKALVFSSQKNDLPISEDLGQALILSSDLNKSSEVKKVSKFFQDELAVDIAQSKGGGWNDAGQGSSLTDVGNLLVVSYATDKNKKDLAEARKLYARSIPVAENEQTNEFVIGREQLLTYRSQDIIAFAKLTGDAGLYRKAAEKQLTLLDERLKGDNTEGFSPWLEKIYQQLPEDKKPELLNMWEKNLKRVERTDYQEYIDSCRYSSLSGAERLKKMDKERSQSPKYPEKFARLYSTAGNTAAAVEFYKKAIRKETAELQKIRLKLELDELIGDKQSLAKDMQLLIDTDPSPDKVQYESLRWSFAENNYRLYKAAKYLGKTSEAQLYLKRAAALGNYDALKILMS